MCFVTATDLKKNLSYYLKLSETERVYITKNKKIISVLSNPKSDAWDTFMSLGGCMHDLDDGRPYEDIIGEEIIKKCGF